MLAQTACEQHLFFLPGTETGHILFKLHAIQAQLAQHRQEQAVIDALGKGAQAARKPIGTLRHIGDHEAACARERAGVILFFAREQAQQAGFAGAVATGQRNAFAGCDFERHGAHTALPL